MITRAETKSANYEGKVFDRNFNKMNWCGSEKEGGCQNILYFNPYTKIKFRSDKNSDYDYDIYSVESGYYYLDEIQQFRGFSEDWYSLPVTIPIGILTFGNSFRRALNFDTSKSGWNKKQNAANYASFETNLGEIVYIGDLDFTFTKQKYWLKGKMNLEVSDKYNDAVAYFRAKHPEYKDKPVIKRLAKPGILLDNYDAGFFW